MNLPEPITVEGEIVLLPLNAKEWPATIRDGVSYVVDLEWMREQNERKGEDEQAE